LRPGDDPTLEASIKESADSNDLPTSRIDPSRVGGQDSSIPIKVDREISLTNNAAQAFVPKEEDRQGLHIILPTYLGRWLISPFQWT